MPPCRLYAARLGGVLLLLAGLVARPTPTALAGPDEAALARAMAAPDGVQVSLLTIGLGPEIYMRAGHSLLRLQGTQPPVDLVFDWGLFDFDDPHFALDFFKGRLTYFAGTHPADQVIRLYRDDEHRQVEENKLELTIAQKTKIFTDLKFWLAPEHSSYAYSIRFSNCSTKIRDLIDAALGGTIKARFAPLLHEHTFREDYRSYMRGFPVTASVAELFWTSDVDRPMSSWEEAFQPFKLRDLLRSASALDDAGHPTQSALLGDPVALVTATPALAVKSPTGAVAWSVLFVGLAMLALLTQGTTARITLGLALTAYGVASFVASAVMLAVWALSDHPELKHNANLWLLWPADILLAAAGGLALAGKALPNRLRQWTAVLCKAHIAAAPVAAALWLLGLIAQDIGLALLALVPVSSILSAGFLTSSRAAPN